jgi:hypothetical protein
LYLLRQDTRTPQSVRLHARTLRLPRLDDFTNAVRAFNHPPAGREGTRDKVFSFVSDSVSVPEIVTGYT